MPGRWCVEGRPAPSASPVCSTSPSAGRCQSQQSRSAAVPRDLGGSGVPGVDVGDAQVSRVDLFTVGRRAHEVAERQQPRRRRSRLSETRTVAAGSAVNVPHGGTPPYITRSTSSTPSSARAGSRGVRLPAISSASTRWMRASWACRRRMKPTDCVRATRSTRRRRRWAWRGPRSARRCWWRRSRRARRGCPGGCARLLRPALGRPASRTIVAPEATAPRARCQSRSSASQSGQDGTRADGSAAAVASANRADSLRTCARKSIEGRGRACGQPSAGRRRHATGFRPWARHYRRRHGQPAQGGRRHRSGPWDRPGRRRAAGRGAVAPWRRRRTYARSRSRSSPRPPARSPSSSTSPTGARWPRPGRGSRRDLGVPTLVVNNAGVAGPGGATWETDAGRVVARASRSTCAGASCRSGRPAGDGRPRRSGRLVNVASNAAFFPVWDDADRAIGSAYMASKAAARPAHRGDSPARPRPAGVQAFAISPGTVKTDMTAEIFADDWDDPDLWSPPELDGRPRRVHRLGSPGRVVRPLHPRRPRRLARSARPRASGSVAEDLHTLRVRGVLSPPARPVG